MTIVIETVCRACGRNWTPSPAEIRAGVWKWCPPCRAGPGDTEPERSDHDTRRAR
jgi:hypothetical protein